jgi:hypothetical protein
MVGRSRLCFASSRFATMLYTKTRINSNVRFSAFLAVEAVICSVVLLVGSGIISGWGEWFSTSLHYRSQTDAFLRGELALSGSPGNLAHDLTWSKEGVQQVWGLGIPFWRLPFELGAKCFGKSGFPDRIALGIFIALTAYLVLQMLLNQPVDRHGQSQNFPLGGVMGGLGGVLLLLCFPPLLSLMQCRVAVYEEALIYVYMYALVLACGAASITRRPTWGRFWLICALAGLGGFVRPTLVFYGVASVFVGVMAMWPAVLTPGKRSFSANMQLVKIIGSGGLWLGIGLFMVGGLLLLTTNRVRFGDWFEFGHRLNVQASSLSGSVYATRFGHPFEREPFGSAARELAGSLFWLREFMDRDWYAPGRVAGQSSTPRWREFYFTTYDLSFVPVLLVGWGAGGWWWRKLRKQRLQFTKPDGESAQLLVSTEAVLPALAFWSFQACVLLSAFYLRAPVLSSRYMMDFAPAFAVTILVGWWGLTCWIGSCNSRTGWLRTAACLAFFGWFLVELTRIDNVYGRPRSFARHDILDQRQSRFAAVIKPLPISYRAGDDLSTLGIPYNGAGWDSETGAVSVCVTLFVEDPEFLELEFAADPGAEGNRAQAEQIQAKVGLEFLEREHLRSTTDGWRIRFAGPASKRYQSGIQPVFIATVSKDQIAMAQTSWRLKCVKWRSSDQDSESPARYQGSYLNEGVSIE